MSTRIYAITYKPSGKTHLVRAATRSQAVHHVARSEFAADVASQDTLVKLLQSGVAVQDAREEAQA